MMPTNPILPAGWLREVLDAARTEVSKWPEWMRGDGNMNNLPTFEQILQDVKAHRRMVGWGHKLDKKYNRCLLCCERYDNTSGVNVCSVRIAEAIRKRMVEALRWAITKEGMYWRSPEQIREAADALEKEK